MSKLMFPASHKRLIPQISDWSLLQSRKQYCKTLSKTRAFYNDTLADIDSTTQNAREIRFLRIYTYNTRAFMITDPILRRTHTFGYELRVGRTIASIYLQSASLEFWSLKILWVGPGGDWLSKYHLAFFERIGCSLLSLFFSCYA